MSKSIFKDELFDNFRTGADRVYDALEGEGNSWKEDTAYYAGLPEGITKKVADEVAAYNSQFTKEAGLGAAMKAYDVFKADDSIDSVVVKSALGKGSITNTIYREKQYTNNFAKEGEDKTIVKNMVMTTKVDAFPLRGYAKMRDSISQIGKKNL